MTVRTYIKYLLQKPLGAFVILTLGLLLGLIPPFFLGVGKYWDNYKLILVAFVPTLYFFRQLLFRSKLLLGKGIVLSDLFWFFFLILGFASYSWATNGGLVWYPAFGWLVLFLWMLMIRMFIHQYELPDRAILSISLLLIFLAMSCHILVIVLAGQLTLLERWNSHFGYTSNYIASYLLALFPFILFYPFEKRWLQFLKLFALFFVLFIINKASAKGAFIGFGVLVSYYVWTYLPDKWGKRLFFSISFLILFVVAFFVNDFFLQLKNFESIDVGVSHRFYILKSSVQMFLEKPLIGQGLGNWFINAYTQDLSNVIGFDHPTYYRRLGTHNLYELILVELGIVGLIVFLTPIALIFHKALTKNSQLSNLQRGAFGALLVYLVTALFYRDVNLYEGHFSSLQFLVFCSLGILTSNPQAIIKYNVVLKVFLLILSTATLIWFICYWQINEKYIAYVKDLNRASNAELLDDYLFRSYFDNEQQPIKNIEVNTELIEAIYHPVFKTTHGYYGGKRGLNRLLPLHLAQLYERQGRYDLAKQYYLKGLDLQPHDEVLLKSYARFLLRYKADLNAAKKYALKAYNIQQNNFYANVLLAEIAIQLNDFSAANTYLNFVIENKDDYGFHNLARVLLIDLLIKEKKYKIAQSELEELGKRKIPYYQPQINKLTQQLKQALESNVKE